MDVKTAGRTVDLFEVFAKARGPLTLSEIARALDAPPSSCFGLIRTLEARGYLYAVGANKRLYPTRKLFEVADGIARFDPVLPRVAPLLDRLRDDTGETVIFGARQGAQAIYLLVAEGRQTIRYIAQPGDLKPLHASAIGKALLMAMPPADRIALIATLPLGRATDRTITDAAALRADIDIATAAGYAQTRGENVADVMAVAIPLSIDGVAYAVALAGPVGRLSADPAGFATTARAVLTDLA